MTNRGAALRAEVDSKDAWDDDELDWQPGESDAMAVAAETSVDPGSFGRDVKCVGKGILAVTKWGRKHGVPARALD